MVGDQKMPLNKFLALFYKGLFTYILFISAGANTVYAQCSGVDFTADHTQGCLPALIKFNATGVPSDAILYWDFGKGFSPGGSEMYENFTESGKYTIRLRVKYADGTECTETKVDYLNFTTVSEPKFGADKTVICNAPATVTLTDSTANVTSREWYINGTKLDETAATITHTFTTPGYKTVTLVVNGGNNCKSVGSKKNYIYVPETVGLSFCSRLVMNETHDQIVATFTPNIDTAVDVQTATWSFPGGNPSSYTGLTPPKVTFNDISSAKDVTLTVKTAGGCEATYTKKSLIRKPFITDKYSVCVSEGGEFTFLQVDTFIDYSSFVFDSKNIADRVYLGNGKYALRFKGFGKVSLTLSYNYKGSGCMDNIEIPNLFELLPPTADFFVDDSSQCTPPDTVHFRVRYPNPPTGTNTYTWYIYNDVGAEIGRVGPTGDSEADFVFNQDGIYSVKMVASNTGGCTDTVMKEGIVKIGIPNPDVKILNQNVTCTGDTIKIENLTTPKDKPAYPFDHEWIFQHADSPDITYTFTERDPSIIIKKPGSYTLTYTVANGENCKNSKVINDAIIVRGVAADFSVDDTAGCAPLNTTLRANVSIVSSSDGSSTLSYRWRLDSTAQGVVIADSTAATTNVTFTRNGCYNITLVIWNSDGCTTEVVKERAVCLGTIAAFNSVDNACLNDSVKIENVSELEPDFYRWMVTPSSNVILSPSNTAKEPVLMFLADGCYDVRLITGKNISPNCNDTFIKQICVETPEANFTSPDTVRECAPVFIRFEADSFPNASYIWDFGDGTVYTTDNNAPVHTYEVNNNKGFDIKLITVTQYGCTDSFSRDNYVKVYGPVPRFLWKGKDKLCGDVTLEFIDSSEEVNSYFMIWGDGSPVDSNQMGFHTYEYYDWTLDSNFFTPTMFAVGDSNCLSSYRDTIILYRPAIAAFEADSVGCAPFTVEFKNLSQYATKYAWDFDGDGTNDNTDSTPVYTFEDPGTYNVILMAATDKGCIDYDTLTIEVHPRPEAKYDAPKTFLCYEDTLKLFDSTITNSPVVRWHWDFGDGDYEGDTSNEQNPTYRYRNAGLHTITLIIENESGCYDTIVDPDAIFSMDSLPPDSVPILYATVDNDSNNIKIVYAERDNFDFGKYHIYRDAGNGWVKFDTRNYVKDTIIYDDSTIIDIDSQSYCYRVQVEDFCGDTSVYSGTHCTMHLDAEMTGQLEATITWTPYIGWDTVLRYELYRKFDKNNYNILAVVPDGAPLEFIDTQLCDFTYTYYVRAIHPSQLYYSSSNRDSIHPEYVYQDTALQLHVTTVMNDSFTYTEWEPGIQPNIRMYIIDRHDPDYGWQTDYGQTTETFFIDKGADVKNKSYNYRVRVQDECDSMSPSSNIGTSILLKAEVKNDTRYFKWNSYAQWSDSVDYYLMQIRNDDGSFTNLTRSNKGLAYEDDLVHEELRLATCYRVMAVERGAEPDTSISNIRCAILPSRIYIPNAFTPNDDGNNEVWGILPISIFNEVVNRDLYYQIRIFNRLGVLVFESNDYTETWDGNFRGKPLEEGVYVYTIEADGMDGVKYFLEGTITMLR